MSELAELFKDPHIYLTVMGTSHPPVIVCTRKAMTILNGGE